MASPQTLDDFIVELIGKTLQDPRNLATEAELREQTAAACESFASADADKSGALTIDELFKLSEEMGLPADGGDEQLLFQMDADNSGEIDIKEWLSWWLKRVSYLPNPGKQQEAIASNMFDKFDADNSGELDIYELDKLLIALGAKFSKSDLEEVLKELDGDNSGLIDKTEFVDWWTQRSVKNREGGSLIALKLRGIARKAAKLFNTDVFTAAWNNDIDLVKSFVCSDPRAALSADLSEHGNGWTPCHYAC